MQQTSAKKTTLLLIIAILCCVVFLISKSSNIENQTKSTTTTSTIPQTVTSSTTTNIATSTNTEADTIIESSKLLEGMELTFEENFNTLSRYLDIDGNITCEQDGIGIWQSVYHFCSRTIPSNYENEIYIDQNFIDYLNKTSQSSTSATNPVTVKDGIVTIEAKPSDATILKAAGSWAKYTSGLLTTQFSFSQQYGYFEMRAQVPAGEGLWPAFWLLPIDKSWPPEIDVMESFGGKNNRNEGGLTQIHYASHTINKSGLCGKWHDVGVDITKGFQHMV